MKNYWLDNKSSWLVYIKEVDWGGRFSHKWYVQRWVAKELRDWIDKGKSTMTEPLSNYLHKDGRWRFTTYDIKGNYTAYYDTRASAITYFLRYKAHNEELGNP